MNPEKLKAWAESRSDWDYVLVKPQDILSLTTLHAAQVAECERLRNLVLALVSANNWMAYDDAGRELARVCDLHKDIIETLEVKS